MKTPTITIDDDASAEWKTSRCHSVTWKHPDEGWETIPSVIDSFLSAAIHTIAHESEIGDANWLFLNFELGRLMAYPSQEDAFECTRSELVFFQLLCDRIEKEPSNYEEWDCSTLEAISERKWAIVRQCLIAGRASGELARARKRHAMKIAAFSFDPSEGLHYLPDLADPEFIEGWKKYRELN